jgi:hypothetical protein
MTCRVPSGTGWTGWHWSLETGKTIFENQKEFSRSSLGMSK